MRLMYHLFWFKFFFLDENKKLKIYPKYLETTFFFFYLFIYFIIFYFSDLIIF